MLRGTLTEFKTNITIERDRQCALLAAKKRFFQAEKRGGKKYVYKVPRQY